MTSKSENEINCTVPEGHGNLRNVWVKVRDQETALAADWSYAAPNVKNVTFEWALNSTTNIISEPNVCLVDQVDQSRWSRTRGVPTAAQCPNADNSVCAQLYAGNCLRRPLTGKITVTLHGANFGSDSANRFLRIGAQKPIQNASITVENHHILRFVLERGEGLDVPIMLSISDVVKERVWTFDYASPTITKYVWPSTSDISDPDMVFIKYLQEEDAARGDYTTPTSGCAKFCESYEPAFQNKLACETPAVMIIFGENFGVHKPEVVFVDECQRIQAKDAYTFQYNNSHWKRCVLDNFHAPCPAGATNCKLLCDDDSMCETLTDGAGNDLPAWQQKPFCKSEYEVSCPSQGNIYLEHDDDRPKDAAQKCEKTRDNPEGYSCNPGTTCLNNTCTRQLQTVGKVIMLNDAYKNNDIVPDCPDCYDPENNGYKVCTSNADCPAEAVCATYPTKEKNCGQGRPGAPAAEKKCLRNAHRDQHVVVELPPSVGPTRYELRTMGYYPRGRARRSESSIDEPVFMVPIAGADGKLEPARSLFVLTFEECICLGIRTPDGQCAGVDNLLVPKLTDMSETSEYGACGANNNGVPRVYQKTGTTCSCKEVHSYIVYGRDAGVNATAYLPTAGKMNFAVPLQDAFDHDPPSVIDILWGPRLESEKTRGGGEFGAIGGNATGRNDWIASNLPTLVPWRIYIMGENFGELQSSLSIKFGKINGTTLEHCDDPMWHQHKQHNKINGGRPYMSCMPRPMTVGDKALTMDVALATGYTKDFEFNNRLTKIKSRCTKPYYALEDEYCVECWFYEESSKSGLSSSRNYAAECSGMYIDGRGHEEPKASKGFAILPPPDCERGGCTSGAGDPSPGGEMIPSECIVENDHTCTKALTVNNQASCHPYRFNGTLVEDRDGDGVPDTGGKEHSFTANRLFCPFIMPCAPPSSCGDGGNCDLECIVPRTSDCDEKVPGKRQVCKGAPGVNECGLCMVDKPPGGVCGRVGPLNEFMDYNGDFVLNCADGKSPDINGDCGVYPAYADLTPERVPLDYLYTVPPRNPLDTGFGKDDKQPSGFCYCDMIDPELYASDIVTGKKWDTTGQHMEYDVLARMCTGLADCATYYGTEGEEDMGATKALFAFNMIDSRDKIVKGFSGDLSEELLGDLRQQMESEGHCTLSSDDMLARLKKDLMGECSRCKFNGNAPQEPALCPCLCYLANTDGEILHPHMYDKISEFQVEALGNDLFDEIKDMSGGYKGTFYDKNMNGYPWGSIKKKKFPAYVDKYYPFINRGGNTGKKCNEVHYTLGDSTCFAQQCGQCNPKSHFRMDGVCEPCPECPICLILIIFAVLIAGSIAMYFMSKMNVNFAVTSIGIDYFQVVSLFAKSKVAWPPEMKYLLSLLQWFQLDIDLAAPECLIRGFFTFEMKWYFKVSFPLIGGIVVFLVMSAQALQRIVSARLRKLKGIEEGEDVYRTPMWATTVSMTVSLVYFLYLSITRAAFGIFNCIYLDPPSEKKYMAAQPLEQCGRPGGLQMRLRSPAATIIVLYCVGFPASIFFAFRRFKDTIARDQYLRAHGRGDHHETNPDYTFRQAMSKLYYVYRPQYWWWFMHIISRKFMLVVNSILFRDNVTFQMAISLGFLFISFCLHITFWPFLGMKERAEIIREEAEANIFLEIQKLEKASRVVKISGKVSIARYN